MDDAKNYADASRFRQALDERLKTIAKQEHTSINDLHRQVVFDRFLARLDPERFVLTGGYSLELRLPKSRSTTDIDLYIRDQDLVAAAKGQQRQAILFALRQQAENDMHDYFSFEVERVLSKLHGPKEGGFRCLVIGKVSNREYHRFHVDVAVVPDQVLEPEYVKPSDRLSFAGVPSKPVSTLQMEEVFANKIHAYTRPRQTENSRVEDLVDMALLIASGLDKAKVTYALQKVFAASVDHTTLPMQLPPPPATWRKEFEIVAERRNLALTIDESFQHVEKFFSEIRER